MAYHLALLVTFIVSRRSCVIALVWHLGRPRKNILRAAVWFQPSLSIYIPTSTTVLQLLAPSSFFFFSPLRNVLRSRSTRTADTGGGAPSYVL